MAGMMHMYAVMLQSQQSEAMMRFCRWCVRWWCRSAPRGGVASVCSSSSHRQMWTNRHIPARWYEKRDLGADSICSTEFIKLHSELAEESGGESAGLAFAFLRARAIV